MGYDGLPSPGPNESAEITIEVRGAIAPGAFKELKDKLKAYLNELTQLEGGKTLTLKRVSIKKHK